ncbi:hypothetical protein VNO77_27808 [Canavalia gladiata]|uniref:Uncharacterized protein n=1 Tax=Canavalia gladiata TaxID=3824 RepID=A0AAN9Q6U5_CANGL
MPKSWGHNYCNSKINRRQLAPLLLSETVNIKSGFLKGEGDTYSILYQWAMRTNQQRTNFTTTIVVLEYFRDKLDWN